MNRDMNRLTRCGLLALMLSMGAAVSAKLPAPSDEAKAKAAEAGAKTAWGGKVAAFKLCKVQDQVAATYLADAKKAGKTAGTPVATPPCTDPGPYAAAAAPATPAPGPAPAVKK